MLLRILLIVGSLNTKYLLIHMKQHPEEANTTETLNKGTREDFKGQVDEYQYKDDGSSDKDYRGYDAYFGNQNCNSLSIILPCYKSAPYYNLKFSTTCVSQYKKLKHSVHLSFELLTF